MPLVDELYNGDNTNQISRMKDEIDGGNGLTNSQGKTKSIFDDYLQ